MTSKIDDGATTAPQTSLSNQNSQQPKPTQLQATSSNKKYSPQGKSKPWSNHDKLPCDELYDDDGIDPRIFFRKSQPRSDDRKLWQLCHQVKQLTALLLAESGKEGSNWEIHEVTPAPNASRLQITLAFHSKENQPPLQPDALQHQLQRWERLWREELAHALHRKRVPTLVLEAMVYQSSQGGAE